MKKQIINTVEKYEKELKKKIKKLKVLNSLCMMASPVISTGGVMASFLMAIYKNPHALVTLVISFFGGGIGFSALMARLSVKIEYSIKEYERELQDLEYRLSFEKERTIDKDLSKENVTEDTKSEVKTQEVEETLNHSYVYDEMEDIPVLKLPQVKTRIRKR